MKKSFFYNHPIIGGLIAMVLVMIICNAIGSIVQIGAVVMEMRAAIQAGEITVDTSDRIAVLELVRSAVNDGAGQNALRLSVAVSALLCLLVFCLKNRKNGYLSPFAIHGQNIADVKLFIVIFVVLDIAATLVCLFTQPGGFPGLPISMSMIVLALYAGFNEEIIDRAIPAALMMRNKPTSRRIVATVLLTSVLFGASHIVNLLAGRGLVSTLIQMIFASGAGLFFIGIYLRTGSIALGIAIHALHDLQVFMINALPETEEILLINVVFDVITNVAPFVFGILMLLPKHHPEILATWAKIWPEKAED